MTWLAMRLVLGRLWGFLNSPLGRVVALAVCGVVLLALADARGYRRGELAERGRWETRLKADAVKARAKEARDANAGQEVGKAVAVKQTEIRTRTEYLTREVVRYVPIDPARASLPVGLVRVHDAAALGLPVASDPSGRADGEPSGIDDVALAETVVGNYGACHANAEALRGWQEWWQRVSAKP